MESAAGYSIGEFRMQTDMSPSGSWKKMLKYDMPKTLGTTQRLKSEFEIIRMVDGKNLLLFLGWMMKWKRS